MGSVLDLRRLLRGHQLDARYEDGIVEEAQEPGCQARSRVGLREVHEEKAPRGGEEGRLYVRRVVQAHQGLAATPAAIHGSRSASQITSAHAAYWMSPGWSWSDEIHPGDSRP